MKTVEMKKRISDGEFDQLFQNLYLNNDLVPVEKKTIC